MARSKPQRFKRYAVHAGVAGACTLVLFPVYWMVVAATQTNARLYGSPVPLLPGSAFLGNVRQLFSAVPVAIAFGNSLLIAGLVTAGGVFVCALAGFGFAMFTFRGKNALFAVLLATMTIPSVITLVPWYELMVHLGWVDKYEALIIPNLASAVGIFFMRQYIASAVPDELLGAARLDGCSHLRFFLAVVLPLVRPALGTVAILLFLTSWNDFLQPLIILTQQNHYTLPLILNLLVSQYGTGLNLLMVGATLTACPVLVVFALMSRQFIRGLTAGALKG